MATSLRERELLDVSSVLVGGNTDGDGWNVGDHVTRCVA
jgi:hypothetical protein